MSCEANGTQDFRCHPYPSFQRDSLSPGSSVGVEFGPFFLRESRPRLNSASGSGGRALADVRHRLCTQRGSRETSFVMRIVYNGGRRRLGTRTEELNSWITCKPVRDKQKLFSFSDCCFRPPSRGPALRFFLNFSIFSL